MALKAAYLFSDGAKSSLSFLFLFFCWWRFQQPNFQWWCYQQPTFRWWCFQQPTWPRYWAAVYSIALQAAIYFSLCKFFLLLFLFFKQGAVVRTTTSTCFLFVSVVWRIDDSFYCFLKDAMKKMEGRWEGITRKGVPLWVSPNHHWPIYEPLERSSATI